ncbi:MAG: nitrilase-related carbon-nitrogen hydrolase [Candidatus Omnitrophota bacterium]
MKVSHTIKLFVSGSNCWNRFLLTQISGFLSWMAFPNIGAHSTLAWICFSFWFLALRRAGWKERIVHGLMFGGWYCLPEKWGVFGKIIFDLFVHWHYSALFFVLFFSCFFFPFVVFSFASPHRRDNGILTTFYSAAWLTVLIAWTPAVFPINPALMIHDQPIAIQTADLGGVYAVVFLTLFVNFLSAEILYFVWQDRRQFLKYTLCLLLTVSFVAGYGMYRIREQKNLELVVDGHYANIAVLETRFLPNEPLASLLRQNPKGGYSAAEMTELAAKRFPQATVIVWPELPIQVTRKNESKLHEKVSSLASRLQKSILYSSMEEIHDATPAIEYCAARLILPDGTEAMRYRKTALIPFFESSPHPLLTGRKEDHYQAGNEEKVLPIDNRTLYIPALCYDLHSQKHLRSGIRLGGNVIVHMSSFYSFNKTSIPYVDYAMSKFCAVEYRIPLARSTNRGYGAFIRTTGEPVTGSETTPADRAIKSFPLFIPEKRSLYAKIGDLFLYCLTFVVVWDAARAIRVKLKGKHSTNAIVDCDKTS